MAKRSNPAANTRNPPFFFSPLQFHFSAVAPQTVSSLPVTQIDRAIRLATVDSGGSNHIRWLAEVFVCVKWHTGPAPSLPCSLAPSLPRYKRCHWHNLTGRLLSSLVEVFQQVICLSFVCQPATAPCLPGAFAHVYIGVRVHVRAGKRCILPTSSTSPSGIIFSTRYGSDIFLTVCRWIRLVAPTSHRGISNARTFWQARAR